MIIYIISCCKNGWPIFLCIIRNFKSYFETNLLQDLLVLLIFPDNTSQHPVGFIYASTTVTLPMSGRYQQVRHLLCIRYWFYAIIHSSLWLNYDIWPLIWIKYLCQRRVILFTHLAFNYSNCQRKRVLLLF